MIPLRPVPMDTQMYFRGSLSGTYRDTLMFSDRPLDGGPAVRETSWSETGTSDYSRLEGDSGPHRLINGKPWAPSRKFMRRGWVITPLGGDDVYLVYDRGNWWRRVGINSPAFPSYLSDYRVLHPSWDSWIPDNEINRLNTEVLIKVGKRQVNYGESLAESRETVRMLSSSVGTALKALLAARRGQWSQVPKILGIQKQKIKDGSAFSQGWLAYNYGWKPLMSDIYDSWQLLQKGFAQQTPLVFSAIRNLKQEISLVTHENRDTVLHGRGESTYTAKVYYRVSDTALNRLNQLGLINPVEIAWAVVPYSFVVDWFLPVGNVLEALSARMGIDFVDGYYGCRRTSSAMVRSPTVNTSNSSVEQRGFRCKTNFFSYERRPMSMLPLPSLYLKSPFSSSHLTSAIALVNQLRR